MLWKFIKHYRVSKFNWHIQYRPYIAFKVQNAYGHKRWYRANRKMRFAVKQYMKLHNNHLPIYLVGHAYINVPLTPYHNGNIASIGVGKIVHIAIKRMPNNSLCARSQFIMDDELRDLFKSYRYMRHDYGGYSRLQIFVNLYYWRRKLINQERTYNHEI